MSKKVFDDIKAGLEDAIAYARGDKSRGRAQTIMASKINVRAIRSRTGLTQEDFAQTYGFSLSNVKKWETGTREPVGPAKAYLAVIAKHPRVVKKVLEDEFA